MIKKENIKRIQELLYKEILSPEGLNFPEILEMETSHGKEEIEPKLISILEFHIKRTDELLTLLYDSKEFLELEIKLKLACIIRQIITIAGFAKNG